jgi:hypothetical protein
LKITSREKIFLIGACGAILLFISVKFIIFPLSSKQNELKDELILKKRLYYKYNSLLGEKNLLSKKIENLKKEIEGLTDSLFQGKTQSLVAAELQKYLEQKANAQGLRFKSIGSVSESESDSDKEKFKTISMKIEFTCVIAALKSFLSHLSEGDKFLIINALRIKAPEKLSSELNNIEMIVSGFYKENGGAGANEEKKDAS